MFEITHTDLAGRIGKIRTNHGTVSTPAYVPVVHPVKQTIPTKTLKQMGFEMVITNAYITMQNHGADAERRGIHKIIGFDGAVMTDSGGYQVLEYGALDVKPEAMAAYERKIGSDIAIPLDKPTGFGLPYKTARSYVKETLADARATINSADLKGQLWAGPIQGGEHFDLVARSARSLASMGFPIMALGSPVEFMEQYEYASLAKMIIAARSAIPAGLPLHLFGSGHPLTIPFSVALGCDTFDSASYALYAKHDRYIGEDGTRRLADIVYFSCMCKVCLSHTPSELRAEPPKEKYRLLSLHNLYAIKAEVDRVREAISEGRLWEYTIKKLRAHPRLYEVLGILVSNPDYMLTSTPLFKTKAALFYTSDDLWRPEVYNYHKMVRRFKTSKKRLCLVSEPRARPAYLDPAIQRLENLVGSNVQVCTINEYLGIIPLELGDIYPAAHNLATRGSGPGVSTVMLETLECVISNNSFEEIIYDRSDTIIAKLVRHIPRNIKRAGIPKVKKKKEVLGESS